MLLFPEGVDSLLSLIFILCYLGIDIFFMKIVKNLSYLIAIQTFMPSFIADFNNDKTGTFFIDHTIT